MTDREAMKLALEALEYFKELALSMGEIERAEKTIAALRTAIEQAEKRWSEFNETTKRNIEHAEWYLSAHPAPKQSTQGCPNTMLGTSCLNHDNTPARWGCVMCGKEFIPKPKTPEPADHLLAEITKLWGVIHDQQQQLAAQRQWTGLTDDDIEQEFGFIDELLRDCVYRTEAKLKEKNG